MYQTIISAPALQALMQDSPTRSDLVIFDCSFDLSDPARGKHQYLEQRIAGAQYASLDADLSAHDPAHALNGGRHPLPTRERFARWLTSRGVTNQSQVIVYDRQGANFCGRLWWMLKWCGHANVAILDAGLSAWTLISGATHAGEPRSADITPTRSPPARPFELVDSLVPMLSIEELKAQLNSPNAPPLIDARASARFKGESEPLDPLAGHIPGAVNRPFNTNFDASGCFKSAAQLRAEFDALLTNKEPANTVHSCGSGVSAVPNLVAMVIAGYGYTTLYPGSWSEWSRVEGAPLER